MGKGTDKTATQSNQAERAGGLVNAAYRAKQGGVQNAAYRAGVQGRFTEYGVQAGLCTGPGQHETVQNSYEKLAGLAWLKSLGPKAMTWGRNLWQKSNTPVGRQVKGWGGTALAGAGLGYMMMQGNAPATHSSGAVQYGNPAQRSSVGNLNTVFDGPAMANVPAMQNVHRAPTYQRTLNRLQTPMFPKTGESPDSREKHAGHRWNQLHDVFFDPPTLQDATGAAQGLIAKKTEQAKSYWPALLAPAGIAGGLGLAYLARRFKMPKIPTQMPFLNKARSLWNTTTPVEKGVGAAITGTLGATAISAYNQPKQAALRVDDGSITTRYKKAPYAHGADVDLSDIARTKRVDSKMPPTATSEHFFKAGSPPDLLTELVDNLFHTDSSLSPSLKTASPKLSALFGSHLEAPQVPVPWTPHPKIAASRVISKPGRTKQADETPLETHVRDSLGNYMRNFPAGDGLEPQDTSGRVGGPTERPGGQIDVDRLMALHGRRAALRQPREGFQSSWANIPWRQPRPSQNMALSPETNPTLPTRRSLLAPLHDLYGQVANLSPERNPDIPQAPQDDYGQYGQVANLAPERNPTLPQRYRDTPPATLHAGSRYKQGPRQDDFGQYGQARNLSPERNPNIPRLGPTADDYGDYGQVANLAPEKNPRFGPEPPLLGPAEDGYSLPGRMPMGEPQDDYGQYGQVANLAPERNPMPRMGPGSATGNTIAGGVATGQLPIPPRSSPVDKPPETMHGGSRFVNGTPAPVDPLAPRGQVANLAPERNPDIEQLPGAPQDDYGQYGQVASLSPESNPTLPKRQATPVDSPPATMHGGSRFANGAPGTLPVSVQKAVAPPAAQQARAYPAYPPVGPPPKPQPPGAARAAVQKQLDSGVPAGQATSAAKAITSQPAQPAGSAEDKPFQLPPNLSGVQMPSKAQNAAAQQAVQSLPQEKTQPGSGGAGANNPPPEARPGDPAYSAAPQAPGQQAPADQGRFYGAIQRAQAIASNRKAYLERRLAARYGVGQSERLSAQQELQRINAGGDNNIVADLKAKQQLGAEDHLRNGFSPETVAGWQGNNQTRNGLAVSTRGMWEQDAANQVNKERGLPTTANQYTAYTGPKAKGLEGVAAQTPVMGQGAGGVSLAGGSAKPVSPTTQPQLGKPMGNPAGSTPQFAGGMNNPALRPPKPPKPGIGSPLGVPGGKAAAYRLPWLEKEAAGPMQWMASKVPAAWKMLSGTGARNANWGKKVVQNSQWGKGDGLAGMAQRAIFQPATANNTKSGPLWSNLRRFYAAPTMQPVWGGMTGSAMGAGVDSLAGLGGYDTGGQGAMYGGLAGMASRVPGVRGVLNRYGNKVFGNNANIGSKAKRLFTESWGMKPSLTGKVQGGLIFGGMGAGMVTDMAKQRGQEAAMNTANQLAQRFGYNGVEHLYNSPVGQGLVGWNRGGIGGAASGAWGALSPQQRIALGLGVGTMGAGLGTMAFTDQDAAGLGMMGLGALGTAHGLGAFSGMGQQADAYNRSRDDMSRNEIQHAQG